jgi:hypothetical protein
MELELELDVDGRAVLYAYTLLRGSLAFVCERKVRAIGNRFYRRSIGRR